MLDHLSADLPDLRRLGVAGLANLVRLLGGEPDAEQTEKISIGGLDGSVGLDQSLKDKKFNKL